MVAFSTSQGNVTPDDVNECNPDPRFSGRPCTDVFVYEPDGPRVTLVSRAASGEASTGNSRYAFINPSGSAITFTSDAPDLVADDTNGQFDAFVYDVKAARIERASVSSMGHEQAQTPEGRGCGYACGRPSVSDDGRYVVFDSWSANLVAGDVNGRADVFLHDRTTGVTELISMGPDGQPGNDGSWNPRFPTISADGRYVVFQSVANNLAPGDDNECEASPPFPETVSCHDIYLRDREAGTTTLVSRGMDGNAGNGVSSQPIISTDGSTIVFESDASNLVPGDRNRERDVFAYDVATGSVKRVSVGSQEQEAQGPSAWGSPSGDGKLIAFYSAATTIVGGVTGEQNRVYVRDLEGGRTHLLADATAAGQECYASVPVLSHDANFLLFMSNCPLIEPSGETGSILYGAWLPELGGS
jgi:Tol biopolymer transport system component